MAIQEKDGNFTKDLQLLGLLLVRVVSCLTDAADAKKETAKCQASHLLQVLPGLDVLSPLIAGSFHLARVALVACNRPLVVGGKPVRCEEALMVGSEIASTPYICNVDTSESPFDSDPIYKDFCLWRYISALLPAFLLKSRRLGSL